MCTDFGRCIAQFDLRTYFSTLNLDLTRSGLADSNGVCGLVRRFMSGAARLKGAPMPR